MRLWMLLAGSLAVIGKEKSSLKLENLVKPEGDRIRAGDSRFFGSSSSFFGFARTLICNWQRPAVSFTLAQSCKWLRHSVQSNFFAGDRSCVWFNLTSCSILKNGQDARSTKSRFSCGTGILPVPKRLIENGARYKFNRTLGKSHQQASF